MIDKGHFTEKNVLVRVEIDEGKRFAGKGVSQDTYPAVVAGVMSPYPIVVTVTMVYQNASKKDVILLLFPRSATSMANMSRMKNAKSAVMPSLKDD